MPARAFPDFSDLHILVVGDLMLDRYLHGKVERISPEAPVPVLHHRRQEDRLGGAANVALNVVALGADVSVAGVLGSDSNATALEVALRAAGIKVVTLAVDEDRPTTVKTRIVADGQQLLRVDREATNPIPTATAASLVRDVKSLLAKAKVDMVVLQDYNKGVLSKEVIEEVIAAARGAGVRVVVDPKEKNFWAYRGVSLFKPNLREIQQQSPFPVGTDLESLDRAAELLFARLGCDQIMITLSAAGIYTHDGDRSAIHPTRAPEIADVSGAGDTVISVAACGLAAGLPLDEVAELANLAGAQVIARPGVVAVELADLRRQWRETPMNTK